MGNLATNHRFTGQKLDPSALLRASETGLMYFNARYYDPEIDQFISPDTLAPDPMVLVDDNYRAR